MKKPSVTELTGLLDKPALLNWANRIGLQGISLTAHRKESKGRGSFNHKQIEDALRYGQVMDNPIHQEDFERFMTGKECIGFEQKIETDDYTGRYDLRFAANGSHTLCDFKSSDGVYLETILQLVAYRKALGADDNIALVLIPDFKLVPIPVKDFGPYEAILQGLVTIYNAKQLIGGK